MSATIHVDAVAPYSLRIDITSADFDLLTVTSATADVRHEDGTVVTWSGWSFLAGGTATARSISRVFLAGDLPNVEVLRIVAILATPSGSLVTSPVALAVVDRFA